MDDVLAEVGRLGGKAEPFCLVQVVDSKGPAPRGTGAVMVVTAKGRTAGSIGGGALETRMTTEAMQALRDGKTRFFDLDLDEIRMNCGGRIKVVVQPIGVKPGAVLFGAGHVGIATAQALDWLGFDVTLVDPNRNGDGLPENITFINNELEGIERITEHSFVVVATSSHSTDQRVVKRIIPKKPRYLGMLASPKKRDGIFQALMADGVPKEALDRIHSPVGLWIHAQTPREIAISIAAEIISLYRSTDD